MKYFKGPLLIQKLLKCKKIQYAQLGFKSVILVKLNSDQGFLRKSVHKKYLYIIWVKFSKGHNSLKNYSSTNRLGSFIKFWPRLAENLCLLEMSTDPRTARQMTARKAGLLYSCHILCICIIKHTQTYSLLYQTY